MNDEQKRKRIETIAKYGALGVVGFFVAPVVFIAVKGIVGLAIGAVVCVTLVNLAPWFSATVANWRLKAIKAEASKNPIETLQNELVARASKLAEYKRALESFAASVQAFKSKLADVKAKFPKDVATFDEQYAKMQQLYNVRADKYQEAGKELGQFKATIEKASIMWDLGQEAAKMSKAAGMGDDEIFAQIQTETALSSVQKSLDTAFADLEISLLDEGERPAAIADGIETPTKQTERSKIQI